MSSERVRIRYDGPTLAEHSIDVDDLAPALLAIGELCKLANKKFNGDRVIVKVLVNANLDQNCFELNLELVQTLLSQAKALIADDNVATAKDLFEWIGIISATGATSLGLLKFFKILGDRKIESKKLRVKDGKNTVEVKIEGDNNSVYISPQTSKLIEDSVAIKNVQKAVKPLAKEGYEKLQFESNDGQIEGITKQEAEKILAVDFGTQLGLPDQEEPQIITAWITVYSPVYEENAKNWKFAFGEKHITIDISETDIAEHAIKRGGALVNDRYRVELEITQITTQTGNFRNRYKIKKILDFRPAQLTQQGEIFNKDES